MVHTDLILEPLRRIVVMVILQMTAWLAGAQAGEWDMNQAFESLERAGLLDVFYSETSMEPVPSGEFILEGLIIERDGHPVSYRHVAGDGAGGAFVILEDSSLALVDSEGSAAILGASLEEALGMMLALGGWQDALRFAGGSDKEAARTAWHAWRMSWGIPEGPESVEETQAIRRLLGISLPADPFGALHDAVAAGASLTFRNPAGVFETPGDPRYWPSPRFPR